MNFVPLDGRVYPRFAGIRTFFRLPELRSDEDLDAADVAILGVPYDGGTSFRPGARFAPEHVRSASVLGRGYNPHHDVHIFQKLKIGDAGDCPVTPQDITQTHAQICARVSELLSHNCLPMMVGGDHSTTIGSMQAVFEKHGPLGVVHFDAHTDTYPPAWGCDVHHGTFMRIAHERGWLREGGVVQVAVRGPFATADDVQVPKRFGFDVITTDDIKLQGLDAAAKRIRAISPGPVYVSFDVDCLDPAYAPGTGTPVPGGMSTWEALQLIRAMHGLNIVAADIVEVSPPYDLSDMTSLVAATVMAEILSLQSQITLQPYASKC